jgi:branched-chain amino acid transport system permease protein
VANRRHETNGRIRDGNERGRKLNDFLQLTLNGLAVGCIYGLVALGFVLIYKATELVNFAQGDLLMLGAFVCYMAVVWWGFDYWLAFALAIVVIGIFGALLDMTILRRVIGQPQFAVVMLTIGLGSIFRTFASVTWGSEIYTLPTPFGGVSQIGSITLSHQYLSIIIGTLLLCGVLYAFFNFTRVGIAMQATSQNQLAAYYMGIPVKLIFSMIWAISAGVATAAGVLLAPVTLIDINMGLAVALKAFAAAVLGGFGSIPGALVGGIVIGLIELYAGATLPEGFKDTAPYIVLLVMLAARPQGLFGTLGRKKV